MPRKNSYLTVTDQFCGAGGSSQGVRKVANRRGGVEVKLALNHWKLAIDTHQTNFPQTIHDCTDISACDPRRYPSTDILITSPECTNHSLAKGNKIAKAQLDLYASGKLDPAAERSRATMWDVPRFAEYHKYNLIFVENVVDARKWVMWEAWLMAMHLLGYKHKCVFLNSMHCHPTPQSRDRMYVVFWKNGNKAPDLDIRPKAWCSKCECNINAVQSWKPGQKTFKYRTGYLYCCPKCTTVVEPYYYSAFNCIDWTMPGTRIGDRKIPLSDATIRRVAYGLKKYGRQPMMVTTRYSTGLDCRVRPMASDTVPTQTADQSHAVLTPFVAYLSQQRAGDRRSSSSLSPLGTQTTGQEAALVVPAMLIKNYGGDARYQSFAPDKPLGTITTQDHHGLLQMPFVVENFGTGNARHIDQPIGCQTAGGIKYGIVQAPFVVENNGKSKARGIHDAISTQCTIQKHGIVTQQSFDSFIGYYYGTDQASHISDALGTCTTNDRHFLVNYEEPKIEDCYYRMIVSKEVGRAMAFEDDYVVLGNQKQQVKQYGNAVTPPAMEELIDRGVQTLQ